VSDDDGANRETRFVMDPEVVVWELARRLVAGQRTLAEGRRGADAARQLPDSPEAHKVVELFERNQHIWYAEMLPAIIANMRVAIEVFDTYGPGRAEVSDPFAAAAWNNKVYVYTKDLDGGPPSE
jgi:hypothetical protein